MHILFVHQNYPAQFGHVARHLARTRGWRCTFASQRPPGEADGIRRIQYTVRGGARETTHYCSRTFENATWHAAAVFDACRGQPDLRPDLIVGHSGFGSTLFLPELYPDTPIINYFEYFYHPRGSDMDFRPEFMPAEMDFLRVRARNAMILLDLHNARRGYSPTRFQRDQFPAEYRAKIDVIFDGIEADVFRRRDGLPRRVGDRAISPATRIVTYVSRGFESMRGFDIFMRAARRIYEQYPDVVFVVVGSDRICYGGDARHIAHASFREHVLAQDDYDPARFLFTGQVPVSTLVDILSLSDLHIYLTVPFVLSWSLVDAMACGCTILASDTEPVREMIVDGEHGRLAGFYDVEGLAARGVEILRDPAAHAHLGRNAAGVVAERYTLDATLPRMVRMYERVLSGAP